MNNIKDKRCKKVLKEVSEMCEGAEGFINNRIDDI